MRPAQHTVRIPIGLDKALRVLAEREGTSVYALIQRSVRLGVTALTEAPEPDTALKDIITELASVSTRVADAERMLERVLFTACAAYGYARAAAMGSAESDEAITAEVNAAYGRQLRLAREDKP